MASEEMVFVIRQCLLNLHDMLLVHFHQAGNRMRFFLEIVLP